MNSRKVVLIGIALAACVGVFYLSSAFKPSGTATTVSKPIAPVKLEQVQKTVAIKPQVSAAAHVSAIKGVAQKRQQIIDAVVKDNADESEAIEVENSLADSLSTLTQEMINNPAMATDAIGLLKSETSPEIMMLLAKAIGDSADKLGDKFPYTQLMEMALNDPSMERRQAALYALSHMSQVPPEVMDAVAEVSRTAPSKEVRIQAIDAMGAWTSKDRTLAQQVSETLLQTREATEDPAVRGMVIQTIGNMDAPLTPKVFDAMVQAVIGEPVPHNRALAAVAIGSNTPPDNRSAAMDALEKAYLSEPEVETQRHIITQIAKAGKDQAESYLQRLPTDDPLLRQDVTDYFEILASVDRNNWDAIYSAKSDRDHRRGTYPSGSGGH